MNRNGESAVGDINKKLGDGPVPSPPAPFAKSAAKFDGMKGPDDAKARALEQARERCLDLPRVRFARMSVPAEFPAEAFDLILVSEVGYYWGWDDLATAQGLIVEHLEPGGHLLLVHWTPYVEDYPLTGDEVHLSFLGVQDQPLRHLFGRQEPCYRLDLFERA